MLIFEHIMLYNMEGELDPAVTTVDIDRAKVDREGRDVSLVTYGGSCSRRWTPRPSWRPKASQPR